MVPWALGLVALVVGALATRTDLARREIPNRLTATGAAVALTAGLALDPGGVPQRTAVAEHRDRIPQPPTRGDVVAEAGALAAVPIMAVEQAEMAARQIDETIDKQAERPMQGGMRHVGRRHAMQMGIGLDDTQMHRRRLGAVRVAVRQALVRRQVPEGRHRRDIAAALPVPEAFLQLVLQVARHAQTFAVAGDARMFGKGVHA